MKITRLQSIAINHWKMKAYGNEGETTNIYYLIYDLEDKKTLKYFMKNKDNLIKVALDITLRNTLKVLKALI